MKKIKELGLRWFLSMVVLGALGVMAFCSSDVSAAATISLTPMLQQIVLVPGETYEGVIEVTNPSEEKEEIQYTVTVGPYNIKETEDGQDRYDNFDLDEKNELNTIMDWVTVKNAEGTLQPGETAKVPFEIVVPKDALAGGQYMAFLVGGSDYNESKESGDMTINQTVQMASKVLAEVAGETVKRAEISDNTIPAFLLNGNLETVSLVENKGNTHAEANYVLQVWPMGSDEEICTNEENAGAILVLPGAKQYHKESCVIGAPGIYKAKQTVTIAGETSILEATIVYCPIWLMLVIVFGIVMIVMWLVMATRGRKKKAARADSGRSPEEGSDEGEQRS